MIIQSLAILHILLRIAWQEPCASQVKFLASEVEEKVRIYQSVLFASHRIIRVRPKSHP